MSRARDTEILAELEASREQWQFDSRVASHQYLPLYDLVRKYVRPGAEVLDWGAAKGHFSYFLVRSGYRTTAYSYFDEGIPRLPQDADFRSVLADQTDPVTLPFETGAFDAVASVGVLEHVRETGGDELASLREIARVLRPGGTFICFHFPNRYGWIDAAVRVTGGKHHTYRYTPGDIRSLVQSSGMRLIEAGRYAILPRNPMHRLRLAQSERVARAYDLVDGILGRMLPWICTNHYFVARSS